MQGAVISADGRRFQLTPVEAEDGPSTSSAQYSPKRQRPGGAVKIGASHTEHEFVVLSQSISGYEVLIGQDFMIPAHCSIAYDSTACMLDIGDPKHEGKRLARLRRPLSQSKEVLLSGTEPSSRYCMQAAQPAPSSAFEDDMITSHKQFKHEMKLIRQHKAGGLYCASTRT